MKKDKIEEFSACIRDLIDALGYKPDARKSVVELINELVAKNKSDSAVLKIREDECEKLRAKVNAVCGKDSHYVNFGTPEGDIPIMVDTDNVDGLKYIHRIYNELREYLKDALNEIDALNEELDNECADRKTRENERDTDSAIIAFISAHYNKNEFMDYEEFRSIVDFCREWI